MMLYQLTSRHGAAAHVIFSLCQFKNTFSAVVIMMHHVIRTDTECTQIHSGIRPIDKVSNRTDQPEP